MSSGSCGQEPLGFGDEGFDVAGVEVGQAGGQPVGVGVAECAGELGGEVVQVFAGVVEVHDGGGLGQDRGGQVPDPGRAVAQDDELADVIGAAAAGLGVHQGGELGGGGEAGQVAGGVRVTHRSPGVVDAGLGEQGGEFDLAGAGAPVGCLAGALGDRGGHHRHAGAVDGDVELVRRAPRVGGCGSTATAPVRDRGRLGGERVPRRRRRRSRRMRSIRLGVNRIPASSASRSAAVANGSAAAARAVMRRSPGDSDAPVTPSSSSRGTIPRPHAAQW